MATVRRALPSEGPFLSDLAIRSKAIWGYSPEVMSTFEAELQIKTSQITAGHCFVLSEDQSVLGFYSLAPIDKHVVELQHLFIDPSHRGQQFGSTLLKHSLVTAQAHHFSLLAIQSDPNAVGFYQKHGIPIVKEVPSSIPGRSLPWLETRLASPDPSRQDHTNFSDAIEHGDLPRIESLICKYPQLVNHTDWTPPALHCAILWNQSAAAQLLLDYGADLELRDPDRQTTPLRYAVMYGNSDVIPMLLMHQANTGPIVEGGVSALQLAREGASGVFEEYEDLPRRAEYEAVMSVLLKHGVTT